MIVGHMFLQNQMLLHIWSSFLNKAAEVFNFLFNFMNKTYDKWGFLNLKNCPSLYLIKKVWWIQLFNVKLKLKKNHMLNMNGTCVHFGYNAVIHTMEEPSAISALFFFSFI